MKEKLESLVQKAIDDLSYDDCFVIEIIVDNNDIQIFLDSDLSITFEKCKKISRYIEEKLDMNLWFGDKYRLTVGSAGIGRPLKFSRQYVKNIGRKIEITTVENKKMQGRLVDANEKQITIKAKLRIIDGKKKKTIEEYKVFDYQDILEGKIKISF